MILKQTTENTVTGDSFGEVMESRVNVNKLHKLYGLLSGLYKNIEESIVREYSSNMVDSHKAAGKDNIPVIVKLHRDGDNSYISFQDFGLGMSRELMRDIYFNYLDSTKEDTDELIGSWGVGSKSALAYTHTFYIDTISEGILYHYMFSKQANGIPAGELLFEESTTDCNGTTVKIPIKNSDIHTFNNAIKNQLIYFPNVYVESNYFNYDNDYTIYEHENFLYRSDSQKTEMHICLGNVYYPIDWLEIGMTEVKIPVAIKFNIGELMPTPSRENIVYGRDSIKMIKDKIELVISNIIDNYNSKVEDVTTLAQYMKYRRDGTNRFIRVELIDGIDITVDRHFIPGIKNPELKSIQGLFSGDNLVTYWHLDWSVKPYKIIAESGNKGKNTLSAYYNSTDRRKGIFDNSFMRYNVNECWLRIEGEFDKYKSIYANQIKYGKGEVSYRGDDTYFICKAKPELSHYKNTILNGVPKAKWREAIKEFQRLSDEYINERYPSYDDLVVPEQWLTDYKASIKITSSAAEDAQRRKLEQKIVYYYPVRGSNVEYVWGKGESSIDKLKNKYRFIVYAETNDKKLIVNLYELFKHSLQDKAKFGVITTAKSYHKHFKDEPHMVEYSEFLKSNHPLLCKLATAWTVDKIIGTTLPQVKSEIIELFAPELKSEAIRLGNFVSSCKKTYPSYDSKLLMDEIIAVVKSSGALDDYMIADAEALRDKLDRFYRICSHFDIKWGLKHDYRYYEYLKALFKVEGLEYNKTMNLKPEFNEIYKLCNPVVEKSDCDDTKGVNNEG